MGNAENPPGELCRRLRVPHGLYGQIFSELRRRNFQTHVAVWVDLSGMTGRNQDAIKKTVAGLLKLLHPHRSPEALTRKEIAPLVEIAVEMRARH